MLNIVDIAFVIDTTGSMGSFIDEAKRRVRDLVASLGAELDIRVVLIDYQDHHSGDIPGRLLTGKTPVTLEQFNQKLSQMRLGGGGDHAESVLDGLDLLGDVNWRDHSLRIAFLVGDAPAHGYGQAGNGYYGGDNWPDGCPCGKTAEGVTARLEDNDITLYGIVVSNDQNAQACFKEFAGFTGGSMVTGNGVRQVQALLSQEFGQLDFDAKVNAQVQLDVAGFDILSIARNLEATPQAVESAVTRLLRRDIIRDPAAAVA